MKKVWLMFLFTFILSPSLAGGVRTCVPDIFSVSYGCGDGVLAGVLPTNQTVAYGAEFTVAALGTGVCTPPDGHELR